MTCKRLYSCNLCGADMLGDIDGIGIAFGSGVHVTKVDQSAAHMCNRCRTDLRQMFAEMDRLEAARQERDRG